MKETNNYVNHELPSISIVIPTYNEENNIRRCLDAIFSQDYPRNRIEVILVDNFSTDKTVEIVKERYNYINIYYNKIKDPEISKMIGLHKGKADLFLYLDADIEIAGREFLAKLINPLVENQLVVGSFPRFIPSKEATAIGRFLRYHPLELDPVFQFFCTEIEKTVISKKERYWVCEFILPRIPPIGICIYRKKVLLDLINKMEKFMDIDVPIILSENGFNRFAHVPSCGIYHHSSFTLKEIIMKRIRNIDKVYLPNIKSRKFTYFNLSKKKDLIKIIVWILYANLFIPELLRGIYKTFKNKDIAFMYEPLVSLTVTDGIIYGFLKNWKSLRLKIEFAL